ncbi:MAG: hypothetical protein EOQ31_34665 [Mesorhizobium sp.]|nr:MAG: hypothetical protein EOQ31_34665 [Mesorhizobium sp.]
MTLHALHRTIQIAFGWEDYHLHAFKLHGWHYGTTWTGERHRDAVGREVTLASICACARGSASSTISAICGNKRAGLRPSLSEDGKVYPVCIAGPRAGPPEDIGGPAGYMALVHRIRFGDIDRLLRGDEEDEEFEDDDLPRTFEPERLMRL